MTKNQYKLLSLYLMVISVMILVMSYHYKEAYLKNTDRMHDPDCDCMEDR